jgi:quinolinate synthase
MNRLEFTEEVAKSTAQIYEKLSGIYTESHWKTIAPYIHEINRLKKEMNAIILAHNYMTPDIFHGIADITGDSLALAREAAKSQADILCQATVLFMAQTSKILCPDKIVLQPDMEAGCTLADAITAQDIKDLREKFPGLPIIAYVNTSAEVKAEVDVCCTSSNAIQIVNAMDTEEVVLVPDIYLAQHVAANTHKKVHMWQGSCVVHERFTGKEIRGHKQNNKGLAVIAHPECPQDVLQASDYIGSTAQMISHIEKHRPESVILVTENSMTDNVEVDYPDIEFIRPCQLCPYMKMITLPAVLKSLQNLTHRVELGKDIAERAKRPIERMLELSS